MQALHAGEINDASAAAGIIQMLMRRILRAIRQHGCQNWSYIAGHCGVDYFTNQEIHQAK